MHPWEITRNKLFASVGICTTVAIAAATTVVAGTALHVMHVGVAYLTMAVLL